MSVYNFEEPPPFDTVAPRASVLSPLLREIAEYLREHPGFRTLAEICGVFIQEKGYTWTQVNEALQQLIAEGIASICYSCKGIISETTCHQRACPHGE